ncbi:unnamed protein product [Pleuronectes platessa]|uniref:Uncharacterized protein n=1 Tax=Pleuronectes platessa TaxID=8262 RepID=A0A9N7VTZ3_PLEPL|nr:unnamed protein product [Pleuronectes platessa]
MRSTSLNFSQFCFAVGFLSRTENIITPPCPAASSIGRGQHKRNRWMSAELRAHIFSSHPTRAAQGCSFQLISSRKPPVKPSSTKLLAATRCPAGELQPATELHSSTEPRRQNPYDQPEDFTELHLTGSGERRGETLWPRLPG